MSKPKEPSWQSAFLKALEQLGEVRPAAERAGIDHSTVYLRRRSTAGFAAAWDAALAAHGARVAQEQEAELAALRRDPSAIAASGDGPPFSVGIPPTAGRRSPEALSAHAAHREERPEELIGARTQLKRAGHDRWGKAKEANFFDALAATANVKRAAAAAGVSANAVYQRRMRDAHFRDKWAAVLETGRAAIEMKLVEAANRAFEPDELDVGDIEPRVSVAEAIRIVQLHGSKGERQAAFAAESDVSPEAADAVRSRIMAKLQRLRAREMPLMLAEGWSFDEAFEWMIPPGWVRAG